MSSLNTLHGMTSKKGSDRRLLQVSLKAELYSKVQAHCAQIELPMTIWVRELIKREIGRD